AAAPAAGRGAPDGTGPIPADRAVALGPGGAGQPGRLAVHRDEPAGPPARTTRVGGLPAGVLGPGGRFALGARLRAAAGRRAGLRGLGRTCISPTAASRSWPAAGARSRSPWPGWPT